ncbi:uncharacterized protein LOC142464223 isoform X3 [Ascaphus truei]|uniref:uncharacterized protein LOC142464223 isoform X3 n=1 Tax=Ascaphus truei TaxID=8439 RepID=UPI003F5A7427
MRGNSCTRCSEDLNVTLVLSNQLFLKDKKRSPFNTMWKWYSGDESNGAAGMSVSDGQEGASTMSFVDMTERLSQTEQLVVQLKELIREKDSELRKKDQLLKEEKESSESKVSKAKLQNKAKIASLSSQLEDLKKQLVSSSAPLKKSEHRKSCGDGDHENASANRGKIIVLRRRVEELESQISLKNEEFQRQVSELESRRLCVSEMDVMLAAKEKKLAEKEAYIIELQISAGTNRPTEVAVSEESIKNQVTQKESSHQDLQILIQNLTRKVGESEERCSLLQEQAESLKSLLNKEKNHFQDRETMYIENIRVFQNIIHDKEKELTEQGQKHEQELFKLAAKSDASADLHQLLKALKQKLHEEEEVLLGKNQVIDVLQKELDHKDQQCNEMNEKCKRLQSEKENVQSKLDAEKHVMRAQLRDMMEKHEAELNMVHDKHTTQMQEIQEKEQSVLRLQEQGKDRGSSRVGSMEDTEAAVTERQRKLQDEVKLKTEEASKSEAKFLKMKAWSKSKIRQLEEELKTSEAKNRDISVLKSQISELENDRKALKTKLESLPELQSLNEQLVTKLVIYEEQQRKLQADLEQVTKRADSQTSESGSADELQNQLLEWNELIPETEDTHGQSREDKSVLALRMAQIEEEREAMGSGQLEMEEELSAARGMGKLRHARRKGNKGTAKLQEVYDYNRKVFDDQNMTLDSIDSAEGENMGGWWPEYSSPSSGLRTVVEELELERNQLQEQMMTLEERCQELEDRLQLQARIESLQSENERLQAQLMQLSHQHDWEAEKLQVLVSTLHEQLKGLTDRNLFLENAIVEKEEIIVSATGKAEQVETLKQAVQEKEVLGRVLSEKLDQKGQQLEEATKKQTESEAESSALKSANNELAEKMSAFKERVLKQDTTLEKLQLDLDQTNEELDKLNSSHLEERSQLIHDLQRCEREMDILKEVLQEKDKEMSSLSASLTEYTEQAFIFKEQIRFKDDQMREVSSALAKAERKIHLLLETQTSDVQEASAKMSSLSEQLNDMDMELNNAKHLNESKTKEAEELIRQIKEKGTTIKNLRLEIQENSLTHNNHVAACTTQITSLKEQLNASAEKLEEMEMDHKKEMDRFRSQIEKDRSEKEKLAGLLEEKNRKEQSFENELKLAKEQYNKLVSGMSKKDEELEHLSKELAEQKEHHDTLNKELQTKQEDVSSLQQKLQTAVQEREEKLGALEEERKELGKQLSEKSEMINKLDVVLNELATQNKVLQQALADRDRSLAAQVSTAEEFRSKAQDLDEQRQHLFGEKEQILKELHSKECEMLTLSQTLQEVQRKKADTAQLLMEEQKTVSKLVCDKDELLTQIEHISVQSLQKDGIATQQLEEKAKECVGLKKRLAEEGEVSQDLHTQMQSLETQLKEAHQRAQGTAEALAVQFAEYNAACENLKQNQEKNTFLQKQVEELTVDIERRKQSLQERDMIIDTHHVQVQEVNASFMKLQNEEQNLREENIGFAKRIEELNASLLNQKADLEILQQKIDDKIEENAVLSSRLEMINNEAEKLKLDKENALLSASDIKTECDHLKSQGLQNQSEADSLRELTDTLKIENKTMSSNIELVNTELAKKLEEINILTLHLSEQGHAILSLKDEIDTILVEKQTLIYKVEEKEALLRQKEELIQQTENKLEGEGHYLQRMSALQNELDDALCESRRREQQIITDKDQELRKLGQDLKLYRDKSEEAELLKVQLSEHVEVISNLHCQIKNLSESVEQLSRTLTKKDEALRQKVDDYVNVKAQFCEVQGSLDMQRNQLETLIFENEQRKAVLSEKDVNVNKLMLENTEIKLKLQGKEAECETLVQQVAHLEEIFRNLQDEKANQSCELNELKIFVKENEISVLKKEALIISQLEERTMLVSQLQDCVQELTDKLKDLENSAAEKGNAVQNLQDKYAALHEKKQELEQSLIKKEEEISTFLRSLNEKNVCIQVAESHFQALTSEANHLREERDKSATNCKTISQALKEKDDVLSLNQQSLQSMKIELESVKLEHQKSATQFNAFTQEVEQKDTLVQNLQEKCNDQSQHIDNLTSDLNNLSSKFSQDQHDREIQREHFQLQFDSLMHEKVRLERALQAEKENAEATFQKHLTEKAEEVQELERKRALDLKESEARACAETLQLEIEKDDLQKQVSVKTEEMYELKLKIEKLEESFVELQQRSERECHSVNERNGILGKHISSLENAIQLKEDKIQTLLKDLHFVEEQLHVLWDEHLAEHASFDHPSDSKSKLKKLSSMLSVALTHESIVTELKQILVARERELDNLKDEKSQLVISFEKERALLHIDLQKLKDYKRETESLMEEIAASRDKNDQQQCLLQEKERALMQIHERVLALQEEVNLSKDELQQSRWKQNEDSNKVLELLEDVKGRDVLVQDLNMQLSQQKELLSALSDQVKEKDVRLMQVMESMSSEMVTFCEEKNVLNSEIQNLESSKHSCLLEISELSRKLEELKAELQHYEQMQAAKEVSLSNLASEKDLLQLQLEKLGKEKENLKRKLHAALVIRKDLMQKNKELEMSRKDVIHGEQLKTSEIRKNVDALNCKLQFIESQNEELQSQLQHVKQELLEKDGHAREVSNVISEKQCLLEELQSKICVLQHSLVQKDDMCQEYVRSIQEKDTFIAQIQASRRETVKTEGNSQLLETVEKLKSHIEKAEDQMDKAEVRSLEPQTSIGSISDHVKTSASEQDDAGLLHQNNTIVHDASLLHSDGNVDTTNKDEEHATLLGTLSSDIKEFDLLKTEHAELLHVYQAKCKEYDHIKEQVYALHKQTETQQELLLETETQLNQTDVRLEEPRSETETLLQKVEKVAQYINLTSELATHVQAKDAQLLELNSEHAKLLRDEIKKLCTELEVKQEEISDLKIALSQLDQYRNDKETMTVEIGLLQEKVKISQMEMESMQMFVQHISNEKDAYFAGHRMNREEIEKLKNELQVSLEKNEEIATLQASLQTKTLASEEEIKVLHKKLMEGQEEANQRRTAFEQIKDEMDESAGKLDKANLEISNLKTQINNSCKEDEALQSQSSTQPFQKYSDETIYGLPETKPRKENRQRRAARHTGPVCEDCSRKEKAIEELECKVLQNTLAMQEQMDQHRRDAKERQSEDSNSKEQVQRKLQAALISRKEALKENKIQKQKVASLLLAIDGLKCSLAELDEKQNSEISLLYQEKEDLLTENERLLMVNENLSAVCESLKSTMETIVEEKEAFSFQLNALQDSQTVELSGWKAKHCELNKEYESLLQAYENISDEIDKMRQVIEFTKKEKHEILQRFHGVQSKSHELENQIQESNELIDKLTKTVGSKEQEIDVLQNEADRLADLLKSSTEERGHLDEKSHQNDQLVEENKKLAENMKTLLEKNQKQNENPLNSETTSKNTQLHMETSKSDVEIPISALHTDKETQPKKVNVLNHELLENKPGWANSTEEIGDLLEKLKKSELYLKQEKSTILKLERDINNLHLDNVSLCEKVKILEDKSLLHEEHENVQEQFCRVKNEREHLERELLDSMKKNDLLMDRFKSLQLQTRFLSQQVEGLKADKNSTREKEEQQLQLLREFEERVRSAQDYKSGTKNKSKELQELLKEKQQEINQLQQDSINFQELILDLERSVKEANAEVADFKKALDDTAAKLSKSSQDAWSLKEELSYHKHLLESAEHQIASLTAEFRSVRSEVGERIESQSEEVGRERNVLQGVAKGGRMPPEPRGEGNSEKINSEICEQKILLQNNHAHDVNSMKENNGVVISRLQELETILQRREEVLQKLQFENQSLKQFVGKTGVVACEVKILQENMVQKEQDFQQVLLEREKFRADLEKQVTISQQMKQILNNKDAEISALISSKDGEISSYLAQIQSYYRKQEEGYEHQLSSFQIQKERAEEDCRKRENELKNLQEMSEKAIKEKTVIANEIEAFRKSMSSLQTDRDLLCSELKDMHHRHQTDMNQKDGIIISTASENNTLIQELRNLLNQVDDLNAENAMLGAQLVRYREELNQVLSLKDDQLKELLRQKLDHIKNLEQEKCDLLKQNKEMQNTNALQKQKAESVELDNQKLIAKVRDQEALIASLNKEKIVFEPKKKNEFGVGTQEVQMKAKFQELQNISDKNTKDAEEKYNKNVLAFQRDARLFGNEINETEQKPEITTYWDVYHENKELKSQNESFGKAMAALQNNRDTLIEDFKVLQGRYASQLQAEKVRGDDLDRQLNNVKSYLYCLLKENSLLTERPLATENTTTLEQLCAEMETVCKALTDRGLEVTRLSSECTSYADQIDAFSKAMASLQHDRERLLQQLGAGHLVRETKAGTSSASVAPDVTESEYLGKNLSQPVTDKVRLVSDSFGNSPAEFSQLRTKVEELERLLQQAGSFQENREQEIASYQYELAEFRTEAQAARHQFNMNLAEKDRQIAELHTAHHETAISNNLYGTQALESVALVGSASVTDQVKQLLDEKQRCLQEIHRRDIHMQQINSKAMETVEMNALLSAQVKTLSQGLKDTQIRYSDLQNQYSKLQRDFQIMQETNRNDIRAEVPPGAPQERANVLVEIDNLELVELRRRLAENDLNYDSTQQELSQLSESLAEERTRREAAEEAVSLAEQHNTRLEMKSLSREYEYSVQMESDEEREALIIDPTQHILVRKMRGGVLSLRRWVRGRSMYCSKLLTSRAKSRYLFLTYLLALHVMVLMCLSGVL